MFLMLKATLVDFETNLRYLKEIEDIGIMFKDDSQYTLALLLNSDYVGDLYGRQFMACYTLTIDISLVIWATLQLKVVSSTTKWEYMALVDVSK